jgi:glucokinase
VPSPSEGGHADWAARTERDMTVLKHLTKRFGRAEVEQVISGPGLVNLHVITHERSCAVFERRPIQDPSDPSIPAVIATAALEKRCDQCVEALSLFVEAYGAEAGNLALRTLATGGVFVGGGIAPKILPALTNGLFMKAFRDKAPFDTLLAKIPVKVILSLDAGLLGAAVYASGT